ncbi:hypothetical protein H9657_17150 [Cellulomonas sp. Sa3CUA2]|uniref:PKD domain-containing protein n=1 Tax=Cellulomonas avistercoris TaxID=2762242 RepID=A0ABR8QHU7_9CELL|nr:hypothetical protein [Cellulomonas avistercoris]MBD7920001.1 hypothetical protein [Cellulomonas avistercoris]
MATASAGSATPPPDLGSFTADAGAPSARGAIDIIGWWSANQSARQPVVGSGVSSATQWQSEYADACIDADANWFKGPCSLRVGYGTPVCAEGETPRQPRWTRFRIPPSEIWSEWEQQDYGSCAGAAVVPVLTAEDFRRLPLPAPVLNVQPDGEWVLVNIQTIVFTDPTPVMLTTEVLGFPVTVEATPSQFTYDWGDGHSTVTHDPGSPYPAFDVFHEYEAVGRVAITLTTEWTGRYQVAGDPQWREVTGTATTAATSRPLDVQERTSRLVSTTCDQDADAPGCEGWRPTESHR